MNIAVDANEANVKNRVGTGQYTHALLSRWHQISEHDFTLYVRDQPHKHLPSSGNNWHYSIIGPQRAWTRFALPWHLMTHQRYDVFWNPAHYLPPYTGCPSVVTIHDLAYEFFPELFLPSDLYKLRRWTRASVQQAARVIAVSASTKRDLVRLYEMPAKKITVIPNGYDTDLFNLSSKLPTSILKNYQLSTNNYVLYVGTIQPRKNIIKLIQAFRLLKESGYKGKLVIAGKVGWLADETLAVIKKSPDQKDIVMTGYVSDEARAALYRHAEVFALPSLYEGFGVGVLEAMASGCPVIASNNSSLPEVVGDAGILFDPTDPVAMVESIRQVQKSRARYIKLGLAQAKAFSWDKCAKDTLKIIVTAGKY